MISGSAAEKIGAAVEKIGTAAEVFGTAARVFVPAVMEIGSALTIFGGAGKVFGFAAKIKEIGGRVCGTAAGKFGTGLKVFERGPGSSVSAGTCFITIARSIRGSRFPAGWGSAARRGRVAVADAREMAVQDTVGRNRIAG
jgi:hypothetical protein